MTGPATLIPPVARMPDSSRATTSWLTRAAAILIAAFAAVLLVAGLFVWTASGRLDVPEAPELAGPSVVTAADGTQIARFTAQVDRRVVELGDISQVAQDAVIAAEDAEFREHTGVDLLATLRALWTNLRAGEIEQGGSTLTQQYVKNTYVGNELSLRRKLEEAMLSLAVERQLTKDEILERYLNTVYFGQGASGIEAAARTYFGIPASELDAARAATLAQLLPAPSDRNPVADPAGAEARRDDLLRRMERLDLLGASQVSRAVASPVEVVEREEDPGEFPYVTQHVRRLLVEEYGEEELLTGALRVETTIRPEAMATLHEVVTEQLPRQEDRPGVDAGAMVTDPATGEVLAWYGGRSYDESQFDLARQARRRPGSTFKPIAYLTAMEDGIPPQERYSAPRAFDEGDLCDPGWGPANAGGAAFGSLRLREGLVNSVNTVFAQVGCDVSSEQLHDTAWRLGVRSELRETPQLAIGGFGSNSTVADLTQVYATFANDGLQCPLHTISRVEDRNGEELAPPPPTTPGGRDRTPSAEMLDDRPDEWAEDDDGRCHRMAEDDDVRRVTEALEDVVEETTGTRAQIDRPQAGKTGTTDDEVDAWFAGYTPDLAMVVRVGDEVEEPLTDIAGFDEVQGGTLPALIWRDAATALLEDTEPSDFPEPDADVIPDDAELPDVDADADEADQPEEDADEQQNSAEPSPSPTRSAPAGQGDDTGSSDSPSGGDPDGGSAGDGTSGDDTTEDSGGGDGNGNDGGDDNGDDDDCTLLDIGCGPGA